MELIKSKKRENWIIAIVSSKDWFGKIESNQGFLNLDNNFVVCKFIQYKGYEPEGKTTLAICLSFQDAKLIFDRNK